MRGWLPTLFNTLPTRAVPSSSFSIRQPILLSAAMPVIFPSLVASATTAALTTSTHTVRALALISTFNTLIFSPPYPNRQFTCDICKYPGGSHWLYRCTDCHGFDAHLGCAIKASQFQFQLHPAPYRPPLTPVYPPYNSGGGGGTAYASTPSSDRWIKIGNCNWVVGRLGGLGTAASLMNIGSTLIETLNQLSGGGSILSF
ncbi:hypothetical protein EJ110_NYTH28865 [Nymphaea thermarum]|nr:hypothetical protein EJ110_NYTH28865 [Nymphaea thermarum]